MEIKTTPRRFTLDLSELELRIIRYALGETGEGRGEVYQMFGEIANELDE